MRELKDCTVGETGVYMGKQYKIAEYGGCRNCSFFSKRGDDYFPHCKLHRDCNSPDQLLCSSFERRDGKSVIFVKVEDKSMKFNPLAVLTAATADQAKVGMWGWFGGSMAELKDGIMNGKESVRYGEIKEILREAYTYRFRSKCYSWNLFYPDTAPQPSYGPFTMESFRDNRERWVKLKDRENKFGKDDVFKVDLYSSSFVSFAGYGNHSWKDAFKLFVFENGEPFGVKE